MVLVFLVLIVGFSGLVRLSFAYTGTITYSAGSDTITAVGGSSGTPITFNDLYLADVAGGWGQVGKDSSGVQFSISCHLTIGNGSSTYFTDSNKEIVFPNSWAATWSTLVEVRPNAVFTLGVLTSAADRSTWGGCMIRVEETDYVAPVWNYGTVYLYSSVFTSVTANYHYLVNFTGRMYNCLLTDGMMLYQPNALDVYRLTMQSNSASEAIFEPTNCNFTDVQISAFSSKLVMAGTVDATFNGLVGRSGYSVVADCNTAGVNVSFVNCVFSTWSFWFSAAWKGYRQYTFDLYVLNGALTDFVEDANVTLRHDGAVVGSWLTNSTGQIDSQVLTYGFYNSTGGNTMYGGTAWNLTITHVDWETYSSVFYPYSEIDWSISMQEKVEPSSTIVYTVVPTVYAGLSRFVDGYMVFDFVWFCIVGFGLFGGWGMGLVMGRVGWVVLSGLVFVGLCVCWLVEWRLGRVA